MQPLIINVALTGMVATRERVPQLPVTAAQIVEDAIACVDAGAAIVHLHARDAEGRPEWRRDAYAPIVAGIRETRPATVICVTTSGRADPDVDRRADVLDLDGDLAPDMASLTLGSLNFRRDVSVNPPAVIAELAARMRERGIRPELEVFDMGMAGYAGELVERGLLDAPLYANVLLGVPGNAPATPRALAAVVDSLPRETVWAAAGIAADQLVANGLAVFSGGHVRTGLEDNPWMDAAREVPATNAALVERAVSLAELAQRPVASPREVRELLGLRVPV